MTETCGRRERKKNQTRRALRAAAVELVALRGFDRVTVEEITDAVDVSPRTFFNHYASKEDALTAPDPERLAQIRMSVLTRPSQEPPLVALRNALLSDAQALSQDREEWLRRLGVLRRDPRLMAALARSWWLLERELIEALTERLGSGPEDLRPAVLATSAVAALRVAVSRWPGREPDALSDLLGAAFEALSDARLA